MISAWTRVSIDFLSKYWRICPIFLMDMVADWQVLVTWSNIERCLFMITPKFRTLVAAAMSTPSTLTTRGCGGVGANLDMKCNTSVLDALMINLFWIDHEIMSVIHLLMRCTAVSLSLIGNVKYTWTSSAYIMELRPWAWMMSYIGALYREKRIGPMTEPWGTPHSSGTEQEKLFSILTTWDRPDR